MTAASRALLGLSFLVVASGCFRVVGDGAETVPGATVTDDPSGSGGGSGRGGGVTPSSEAGADGAAAPDVCTCDSPDQRCIGGVCVDQTVANISISVDAAARFSICFTRGPSQHPAPTKIDDECVVYSYEWTNTDIDQVDADIGIVTIEGEHGQKYQFGPHAREDLTKCYVPLNDAQWAEMDPGERVHVTATGGKDVSAFSFDLKMPGSLVVDSPPRTFSRGAPFSVEWHPAIEDRMTVSVYDPFASENPTNVVYCNAPNTGSYSISGAATQYIAADKPAVRLQADTSHRILPGDHGIVYASFASSWPVPVR